VANDAETSGPLGDEHAAVGHERDAPRMIESSDRRHVKTNAAAASAADGEVPRTGAQRVDRRGSASSLLRDRHGGHRGDSHNKYDKLLHACILLSAAAVFRT